MQNFLFIDGALINSALDGALEILGLHLADVVNYQAQIMVIGFSLFGSLYSISLSFLNWLKWKRVVAYDTFKTHLDFLFLTGFFYTFLVP